MTDSIAEQAAAAKIQQDRDAVRDMLAGRYHGSIEPTEEMIDVIMAGLTEAG